MFKLLALIFVIKLYDRNNIFKLTNKTGYTKKSPLISKLVKKVY